MNTDTWFCRESRALDVIKIAVALGLVYAAASHAVARVMSSLRYGGRDPNEAR